MTRSADRRSVVRRLNEEWERLVDVDPPAVRQWAARRPALSGCAGLDQILPLIQQRPDPVLGALLTERALGDPLAGRIVVQAMLGKLVVMARRTRGADVDDFVAALWIRVATYPLAARPSRIAANLAMDTLKTVTKESIQAGRPVAELIALPVPAPDPHEVTARRVIAAGRRLGLINGVTGEAMESVYADGLSGRQTAVRLHTSPEMVRYRCSDGTRRLARHRTALLDAA